MYVKRIDCVYMPTATYIRVSVIPLKSHATLIYKKFAVSTKNPKKKEKHKKQKNQLKKIVCLLVGQIIHFIRP